jgi:hypothetical protein
LILDELSEEQLRVVKERDWVFFYENFSEWNKAIDLAIDASKKVIGEDYADYALWAAWDVTKSEAARWATLELIAMHKILEDHQKPLTFFQMFLEVL